MTERNPKLTLRDDGDLSPPTWPDADADTEAAIGRLVIAWGVLEREIDQAIRDVYGLNEDSDLGSSITANLGTKAKLEIFQSAVHCLAEYFDTSASSDADKLVNATATASSAHRNFVAHGQPIKIMLGDTDHLWAWITWQARKGGPKGKFARLNPLVFDNSRSAVVELIDQWHAMRLRLAEGLKIKAWADRQ